APKCTKRADPDPKILPACKPPPIRDRKTESANPRYGEGFFSKLLERKQALGDGPATGRNCIPAEEPEDGRALEFHSQAAPTTAGMMPRYRFPSSIVSMWRTG